MPDDDKMVGQSLQQLIDAEYVQIEFRVMAENQLIKRGKAVVVLNGNLRIELDIPPQRSQGKIIVIPGIQDKLRAALQ